MSSAMDMQPARAGVPRAASEVATRVQSDCPGSLRALKGRAENKFGVSVMALRVIDSLVLRCEPLILLLGRVCIGSLYLMSGTNHWLDLTLLTRFMTGLPGSVYFWAMLAATIEVVSGAALVLGFRTRDFALLLVLFNLCAAVIGASLLVDYRRRHRTLGPIHPFLERHRARRWCPLCPRARRRTLEPRSRVRRHSPGGRCATVLRRQRLPLELQ